MIEKDIGTLFDKISSIIEIRKQRAGAVVNQEITLMYWEIGKYLSEEILKSKRADYGKRIVATLSQQLLLKYGKTFEYSKMIRMMQFAELFPDKEIVATLSQQLSWSHFTILFPLKNHEKIMYYANDVMNRNLGVRALREEINRKSFERREIANTHLSPDSQIPFNVFKDPYLLDVLGLKENYLEADLEKAILTELEAFMLEFGHGFSFIERQKRMVVGNDEIILDLLFYNRKVKRLVAVELKIGEFKAAYKGQMELYLNWLNRYEKQGGEEPPIGIILCASANRDKVELLNMDGSGIAVAEYWTSLPPKELLEAKLKEMMNEAKERLERQKSLGSNKIAKQIEYFYEYDKESE